VRHHLELTCLVDAPGASSLPYVDPAFPDRPPVLHAARPRKYNTQTPVLFVHHGVRRNGTDYPDRLDLVRRNFHQGIASFPYETLFKT
jgi:hypothetical protein